MTEEPSSGRALPVEALTGPEVIVIQLVAQGKTTWEIARRLALSEHTVDSYMSNILRKSYLTRQTQSTLLAARAYSPAGRNH